MLGLTKSQPQQHTSALGEYLGLAVKYTGSCLAEFLLLFRGHRPCPTRRGLKARIHISATLVWERIREF